MARIAFVFLLLAVTIPTCILPVSAQDTRNDAQTQIVSARYQLDDSFQRIQGFWQNLTDQARTDVAGDLRKSYHSLFESLREFDAGFYNNSVRFARLSRFFAARAQYRVFLDLAHTMIMRANQTIASIPTSIPEPQYAKDLWATANSAYWKHYYEYLLNVQGGDVDEFEINELIDAEKMLYSDDGSAFNCAANAMRKAEAYRSREEANLRKRTQEINSQLSLAIIVVLVFASVASVYSIRPIILGLPGRTEKWRGRTSQWIRRNFRGFGKELEQKRSLGILLRTCGTLLGSVASLLVILYILNSIFVSHGYLVDLRFATTVLGGLLGPIVILALSLTFGVISLYLGPGTQRQVVAFVSLCMFLLGAVYFAGVMYAIQQAMQFWA